MHFVNAEKIVFSFLTGKEEENLENIRRENSQLSNEELIRFADGEKEMDVYSYLENNHTPHRRHNRVRS